LRIKTYIERLAIHSSPPPFPLTPATVNQTKTSLRTEMQETMMLGLRLTREGVSASNFRERFGRGLIAVFGKEIDELTGLGLLEWVDLTPHPPFPGKEGGRWEDGSLRLTPHGRLLGNQAFMRFVGD
jgi:oxygen-independent coproporphyrinogen-3 oxidase